MSEIGKINAGINSNITGVSLPVTSQRGKQAEPAKSADSDLPRDTIALESSLPSGKTDAPGKTPVDKTAKGKTGKAEAGDKHSVITPVSIKTNKHLTVKEPGETGIKAKESLAVLENPPSLKELERDSASIKSPAISKTTELSSSQRRNDLINFEHLESLEFKYKDPNGREITSWAIYAEPDDPGNLMGDYHQVGAPGEGYGCVDDVARVTIVYLNDYEKTGDPVSLEKAKKSLEFVMSMADGEGEYYNFVDKDGNINTEGNTSEAEMDWWSARAFYALGKGIALMDDKDKEFTSRMEEAYEKTLTRLIEKRDNPQVHEDILPVYERLGIEPGTLVNDSGCVTSIVVLGLLERYKEGGDPRIERLIRDYCNSMEKIEEKSPEKYPLTGFHYNALADTDLVELYGNRQVKALADAGAKLGEKSWIESAEREADRAYPRILGSWGLPFALSPDPERYPQIAYSVESVVSNLMAVYEAAGKEKYAAMAGLAGSWFFGNNPAGKPVYIPSKGRSFDGIDGNGINRNSGAESNIETLLAIEAMEGTPAERYLNFTSTGKDKKQPVLIPAKDLTPSGSFEKIKRTFSGGAVGDIFRLDTTGKLEGKVKFPENTDCRAYMSYRSEGSDDGSITVKINGKKREIPLENSRADYHYRPAFLGKIEASETGEAEVSIENKGENREVIVSSLVIQPDIQEKSWTDGTRRLTLLVNTTSEELPVRLEKMQNDDSGSEIIYTGEGSLRDKLPPSGWVMREVGI